MCMRSRRISSKFSACLAVGAMALGVTAAGVQSSLAEGPAPPAVAPQPVVPGVILDLPPPVAPPLVFERPASATQSSTPPVPELVLRELLVRGLLVPGLAVPLTPNSLQALPGPPSSSVTPARARLQPIRPSGETPTSVAGGPTPPANPSKTTEKPAEQPPPARKAETATPATLDLPETPPSRRDRAILQRFQSAWRILVWPAGSAIAGCFMEEKNVAQREAFVRATRAWSSVANITFDFGAGPGFRSCRLDNPSEMRVTFRPALASRSEIGTLALDVHPAQPTLYISTGALGEQLQTSLEERIGVMIHELGHALAMPHEHQHPLSPCPAEYRFDVLCPRPDAGQNITAARYASVLAVYSGQRALISDPDPTRLLPYDVKSVMHYRYPPGVLKAGRSSTCYVNGPFVLSEGDRAKLAVLYPRDALAQTTMIRQELIVLARAIAASGMSAETAQSIKALVEARLARKFPDLAAKLDLTPFSLPQESRQTRVIEENLVAPLRALTPVCRR